MGAEITDDEIRELTASAEPFTMVILRWTADRSQPGADTIERAHQRRLVTLRAEGVIAMMAPVLSGELAGVLLLRRPREEAAEIIARDPCVEAGMQTFELHPCLGLFDVSADR